MEQLQERQGERNHKDEKSGGDVGGVRGAGAGEAGGKEPQGRKVRRRCGRNEGSRSC